MPGMNDSSDYFHAITELFVEPFWQIKILTHHTVLSKPKNLDDENWYAFDFDELFRMKNY